MAMIIGRSKSWLWWLAGLFCALVFGRAAGAAEAQPEYGVRVDPKAAVPAMPAKPRPPAPDSDDLKQKANKLIDEYLSGQTPPAPGEELKAKIAKLVKELGADDWAVRENASKEIVAVGKPALAALKEAANSKDAEVAQRAKDALAQIEGSGTIVDQLRALGGVGQTALQERTTAERKAVTSKAGEAGELELAGRKDEAEKLRAAAKQAQANVALLVKLQTLMAQAGSTPGPGMPVPFGVKMMMIERN
jgi:hypothetical protein